MQKFIERDFHNIASRKCVPVWILGYHNVDIYKCRKIKHREPNVESYGQILLKTMVENQTSKAMVE